ncbi:eukaryotic translation initiation factor 5A [Xylariomycetidae sp. FL0641]|nr:eukaryotic translation initiation factor 5A [Xylariomycetidae sp. FL0641]
MADDSQHEHQFDNTDSQVGSETYPMQCSALRKGGCVVIKNRPCKIVDMSTSKTGKHGHAKVHLVAIDIFTDKKLEELCPSTHNMDVPNVRTSQWTLLDIEDDFLHLMGPSGEEKNDIRCPDTPLGKQARDAMDGLNNDVYSEVTIQLKSAMGEEHLDKVDTKSG